MPNIQMPQMMNIGSYITDIRPPAFLKDVYNVPIQVGVQVGGHINKGVQHIGNNVNKVLQPINLNLNWHLLLLLFRSLAD